MEFEYDLQKSEANERKHGIALEEAKKLWEMPAVTLEGRILQERRFVRIGLLREKFYSCVFTYRDFKIRLISLRRSRDYEIKIYWERSGHEKEATEEDLSK